MSLSDLEKEIIAEGEKIRALAAKGALELRKSQLVDELKDIERQLEGLVKHKAASKEEDSKAPAEEPEAKPAPRKRSSSKAATSES